MEDNVVKELDDMELIVSHWKADYMRSVTGENDDFLLSDFLEEVDLYVYNKVCRLRGCEHINYQEAMVFMDRCYKHVRELKEAIDEARK